MEFIDCWHDDKITPEKMVNGALGQLPGWKVLEKSDHFTILKQSIDYCKTKGNKLLDLGCGAGEVGRVFNNFDYTGADLSNIIENVSKKINPNLKYTVFDVYDIDLCSFIKEYDIVLLNAVIDILERPLEGLNNVLKNSQGYVVIHRQNITNIETHIKITDAYGGKSFQSYINRDDFYNTISINNYRIREVFKWGSYSTFILEK